MIMAPQDGLVLVTGGSGYIALHVIAHLLREGYRVRTTLRDPNKESSRKPIMDLENASSETVEFVPLDLLGEQEQFDKAAEGCTYVLHTASPFPSSSPKNDDELIIPAREGTLKMLKGCAKAGVRRVVVTSSVVAVYENEWDESMPPMDETWWSKPERTGAYGKSKLAAERAAWEYHESLPEDSRFELATVNPGFVLGPMLSSSETTSTTFLRRFMNGEIPAIPNLFVSCVDVRDVAKLHLLAMTSDKAPGERFIAAEGTYNFSDIAKILRAEMKQYGYSVTKHKMPWLLAKPLSYFIPALALIIGDWGNKRLVSGAKAERTFEGFKYTDINETVVDMAHSTIERKLFKETDKYKQVFGEKPYSADRDFV